MKTLPSRAYVRAPPSSQATVVSRRLREATGAAPVFRSRKQPVPYVFFARPGRSQACPKRAACWSPAMPAIGTWAPSRDVVATTPEDGTMRGRTSRGTSRSRRSSSSHAPVVDVVEERPARVRGVRRVHGAARELPDEPRVDRPERELPAGGPRPRAGHVVEEPLQLRPGEVGVEDEARLRRERRLVARRPGARRRSARSSGPARRSRSRGGGRSRAPRGASSRAGS